LLEDKWGFIDKTGKVAIPCQFELMLDQTDTYGPSDQNSRVPYFSEGLAVVRKTEF